jgi:branched-chain amino acid transport system ATP-binding protein/sulfate-transporting ATPase
VSTAPLLEARGLSMRFGGVTALDALDLVVHEHEILGLLGPNGSGKTTFFNVVTGLYAASDGALLLDGAPITRLSPQAVYRAGVTRTFQRSRLSLSLSVFDNVALGCGGQLSQGLGFNLLQRGALRRQVDVTAARVQALLATFSAGLADTLWRPAGTLSMIDRRRVEVCRALVSNPRLVLLDEPSAGMTHDETRELMDDILMVRARLSPFTIVIIEHEMGVIQRITQRCVVLNYGRKIAEGRYDEIVNHPEVQVAYLGQDATCVEPVGDAPPVEASR